MIKPYLLVSDDEGNLFDIEGIRACGRAGASVFPLEKGLMELPEGAQLFMLPGRRAVGYSDTEERWITYGNAWAVAAYLPPGVIQTALPMFEKENTAPPLPFFSYTAVGFKNGKYYVPAFRLDRATRHQSCAFDNREIEKHIRLFLKRYPHNRLVRHLADNCVRIYGCPNAKNLFLRRWEAPIAVSPFCNATCAGCISEQPDKSNPSPQQRLDFIPTVEEIVEIAVPHLEMAPNAIISYGQGCEGEPLLQSDRIAETVREIRKKTKAGVLHMNTNGSLPDRIEKLFVNGLDSIRISINSAQKDWYHRYFRPKGYDFENVIQSLQIAAQMKKFASINYLIFPGVTDTNDEFRALCQLIRTTQLPYIQWRNLNIDPDNYLLLLKVKPGKTRGIETTLRELRNRFPQVTHGCVNTHKTAMNRILRKARSA